MCGPVRTEVLFRPLTKLQVKTAVRNIINPHERTFLERSGHPDTVQGLGLRDLGLKA